MRINVDILINQKIQIMAMEASIDSVTTIMSGEKMKNLGTSVNTALTNVMDGLGANVSIGSLMGTATGLSVMEKLLTLVIDKGLASG